MISPPYGIRRPSYNGAPELLEATMISRIKLASLSVPRSSVKIPRTLPVRLMFARLNVRGALMSSPAPLEGRTRLTIIKPDY
jgi:hypothetical protein